jgi:L-rhamnose mutarotase
MAQAIRASGIRNYTISFRADGLLCAYLESDDPDRSFAVLGKTEVNARWQKMMDRFFVKGDATIVGPEVIAVEEVFHLD